MRLQAVYSLIIFLSFYSSSCWSEEKFISLIAPAATFRRQPYTTFLTTSTFDEDIDIAIKYRSEVGLFKIRRDQVTEVNSMVNFERPNLTERLVRVNDTSYQAFPLTFLARKEGKCIDKKIWIVQSRQNHVILQLDKPFYKPGDEIKIRAIVLNENAKPIGINNILVEIKDSEGNIVKRLTEINPKHKNFGLYEGTHKLAEDVNLGTWTISVKINNDKRIFVEKKFKVDKLPSSNFNIVLNTKEKHFLTDKKININFYAKYTFGEYVRGFVKLQVFNAENGKELYANSFRIESFSSTTLDMEKDLGIKILLKNEITLTVMITFIDMASNKKETLSKNIKILTAEKYSLKIIKFHPYKEGLKYKFNVQVKDKDGEIVPYSDEPVKMFSQIKLRDGTEISLSRHIRIKNNFASFNIDPFENVDTINIKIEYKNAKLEENIMKELENSHNLRVSTDKKHILEAYEEDITVTVEHSQGLNQLVILAIGRLGIVYSMPYHCDGKYHCLISLENIKKHYDELKPEAKIVVYSVEHYNKQALYGSSVITFDGFGSNYLDVSMSNTKLGPKNNISLIFSSKKNSLISLLAIDKKLLLKYKGHDITKQDLIDTLTNTKKLVYMQEGSNVMYDSANHNFVINLSLDKLKTCTAAEEYRLDDVGKLGGRSKGGGTFYRKYDDEVRNVDVEQKAPVEGPDVRENFPETWIWDTIDCKTGREIYRSRVPDSMTTWVLTAFSLNKDHGFALAEPQELIVSKEFFVDVNFPHKIRFGEVFQLEVLASNYVPFHYGELNVTIKVFAEYNKKQHFEFRKFTDIGVSCKMEVIPALVSQKSFPLYQHKSKKEKFLIRPLITKEIKIRIKAEARDTRGYNKTWTDEMIAALKIEDFASNSSQIREEIFNVEVNKEFYDNFVKIEGCVSRINDSEGIVGMEFYLAGGFVYSPENSNPMRQNNHITNVEVLHHGTKVILYFSKLPPHSQQCVNIFAKKEFDVIIKESSTVSVYELNKKELTFTTRYLDITHADCRSGIVTYS